MTARRVIYTNTEPVVGKVSFHTWPWPANLNPDLPAGPIENPAVAVERMYWRATGKLAYAAGTPYPSAELPELVGETEHHANMRGVETRVVTAVPEQRNDDTDIELLDQRRPGGRPRMPRDEHGNIIRP